ncbi:hypothetical protein J6590_098121 [Homalodisca vitripennis]|nr:hypothetical protein J6590_098121 [Homalodisca vitripennis]
MLYHLSPSHTLTDPNLSPRMYMSLSHALPDPSQNNARSYVNCRWMTLYQRLPTMFSEIIPRITLGSLLIGDKLSHLGNLLTTTLTPHYLVICGLRSDPPGHP